MVEQQDSSFKLAQFQHVHTQVCTMLGGGLLYSLAIMPDVERLSCPLQWLIIWEGPRLPVVC